MNREICFERMNDMRISFDDGWNRYEYEMHEVSGNHLREYILAHPNEDFQTCVMICGELISMHPIESVTT